MVKLYTMVKDEADIIEDWILYHAHLFGFNNLYVVDNFSTDGTYEILLKYKEKINIFREKDYSKKGILMKYLIDKYSSGQDTIAFPIDSDEFIVFYDKSARSISVDKNRILTVFNTLPNDNVYKANYLLVTLDNPQGYMKATEDAAYAIYQDYGKMAKSFIKTNLFKGAIDHGNHIPCDNYFLTDLVLVHYHNRSLEQSILKTRNNVSGFNYPIDNKSFLEALVAKGCNGSHHVKHMISILNGTYTLPHDPNIATRPNIISLKPLNDYFESLHSGSR